MENHFWNCRNSSSASVFWVAIYGGNMDAWWHRWFIYPAYRFGRTMRDAKYWVYYRIKPSHRFNIVRTGLPPGYYDQDTRLMHACFAMLIDYIEEEGGPETMQKWSAELRGKPDPNAPEGIQSNQADRQDEAVALYHWWKTEKPADEAKRDIMLTEWDEGRGKPGSQERWDAMQAMDEKIEADEQTMLHRLINIRRSLWT